jgi:hypothetical protein
VDNHQLRLLDCAKSSSTVKDRNFRDYGAAEAHPGFKPAGLTVFIFLFLYSFHLLIWNFRVSCCSYEGTAPYRSSAQITFREKAGVSFVALGILLRTANSTPLIAISRNLAPSDKLTCKDITQKCLFQRLPQEQRSEVPFSNSDSHRSELS